MGLGNFTGNRVYLNLKEGEIAMKKDGQTYVFDHVTGVITDLILQDGKFGKELHVNLIDGPESYILQMKFDSGYSRSFLMAIKNADLKRSVTLAPKYKEDGEKKQTALLIIQDQHGVKWYYTRDNPNGCPQPVEITYKGKTQWDNTAQMRFLENMIVNDLRPLLTSSDTSDNTESSCNDSTSNEASTGDDLPF